MKKPLSTLSLIIAFCFIASSLQAQQDESKQSQLIVYKDYFFLNSNTVYSFFDYDPEIFNDFGYAIALHQTKGDRKYKQIEFKFDLVNSSTVSFDYERYVFQFSYRRGKYWKKNILKTIRPKHSLALHIDYFNESSNPFISSVFPVINRYYGLGLDYLIGVEIPLGKSLNLHLDTSLFSVNFGNDQSMHKNPTLTLRQQTQGGFSFNAIGQRVLKLGLAFKI